MNFHYPKKKKTYFSFFNEKNIAIFWVIASSCCWTLRCLLWNIIMFERGVKKNVIMTGENDNNNSCRTIGKKRIEKPNWKMKNFCLSCYHSDSLNSEKCIQKMAFSAVETNSSWSNFHFHFQFFFCWPKPDVSKMNNNNDNKRTSEQTT